MDEFIKDLVNLVNAVIEESVKQSDRQNRSVIKLADYLGLLVDTRGKWSKLTAHKASGFDINDTRHQCRFCQWLVTGNGIYCEAKNEEKNERSTKRVNRCHEFEFNEIDAYDLNRKYVPPNQEHGNNLDNYECEGQLDFSDIWKENK